MMQLPPEAMTASNVNLSIEIEIDWLLSFPSLNADGLLLLNNALHADCGISGFTTLIISRLLAVAPLVSLTSFLRLGMKISA